MSLSVQGSQSSSSFQAIQKSLGDRHLDANEYQQLSEKVKNDPDLSDDLKQDVMAFLDQAHKDSKGFFFGLLGKGISDFEMDRLQQMAQSFGDNDVLSSLVQDMESARQSRPAPSPATAFSNHLRAKFEPALFQIPDKNRAALTPDFDKFYVSQNGNNLPSGGGDCGPAAAAMVLKRFGVFDSSKSSRDSILAVRQAAGVTRPRGGAWALNEAEVGKSIEKLSGGRVRQSAHHKFSGGQSAEFRETVKAQLAQGTMPIIELGSPYGGRGRHYMVAMEVKANGNIVVADSGGLKCWEITPEKLSQLMRKADARGGSHIMSFAQSAPSAAT
jgi:hypothetical protein